jgi:hypothetical protein
MMSCKNYDLRLMLWISLVKFWNMAFMSAPLAAVVSAAVTRENSGGGLKRSPVPFLGLLCVCVCVCVCV